MHYVMEAVNIILRVYRLYGSMFLLEMALAKVYIVS